MTKGDKALINTLNTDRWDRSLEGSGLCTILGRALGESERESARARERGSEQACDHARERGL
jgi:hypothetical protein